jgi:type II secretory pathway pseudopilin PulG
MKNKGLFWTTIAGALSSSGHLALVALVLGAATAGLATEPELDPLELQTLRDLQSVVLCVEAYQLDNGAVPGPTDGLVAAEFLRPYVQPPYIRSLPANDGWGNPFLYWSDGARFMVVSFGQDGMADRTYDGVTAEQLEDGGDDVVFLDGTPAAVPLHLRQVIRAGEQKLTMADMRSLGTCVEAYKIDSGTCPGPTPGQVTAEWMRELVEPVYIRTLPIEDAWGNPFIYWCDGEHYRIASLGLYGDQDGPFEEITRGTGTQRFTSDIVFEDGEFVQFPQGAQH